MGDIIPFRCMFDRSARLDFFLILVIGLLVLFIRPYLN